MNVRAIGLASQSPRRRELLRQIGLEPVLLAAGVDETPLFGERPGAFVLRLAEAKARAGAEMPEAAGLPVLGADTAVVADGRILGKPRDRADAMAMLLGLAAREHQVYTGVALLVGGEVNARLNVSRVRFRGIERSEAAAYWASGEPADKAGGYAIQGLGAVFVADLQGSYSGVMGLPLFETAELLRECGIGLPLAGSDRSEERN